jgi:probable rRNA maturation factor
VTGSGHVADVHVEVRVPRLPGGRAKLLRALRALGALAARRAHVPLELTYALVSDEEMAELHERFTGHAGPTDVLAFPLLETPRLVGDVVVSVDTARREAARRELPAYDELLLYAVHGTLHLLGHDDHAPADRKRMRRAERDVLRELGVPPTYRRRIP